VCKVVVPSTVGLHPHHHFPSPPPPLPHATVTNTPASTWKKHACEA